jgi:hypothetical protein
MSTSPINPVFGDSSPRQWPESGPAPLHPVARPQNDAQPAGTDYDSPHSEINSIANAIEELQNRLERANNRLGQAATVRTTELEIGRLFVEAQRFSEASISELEHQIQEILAEAEAKAMQILREATDEAHEIRRQAQESSLVSARAANDLQAAIAGFSVVNNALVSELNALNSLLAPADAASAAIQNGSGTMGRF